MGDEPITGDGSTDSIEQLLEPWESSVGGIPVSRLLPSRELARVGAVAELERIGPMHMDAGAGLQLGPSPRLGVATLTYPIQGEIVHRDSLGVEQLLTPGEVTLVVAGKGLTISERSTTEVVEQGGVLDGVRLTLLLPEAQADCAPRVERFTAAELPSVDGRGWFARVLIGSGLGVESPLRFGSLFLADVTLAAGAELEFDLAHGERAVLAAEHDARIDGLELPKDCLAVVRRGRSVRLSAEVGARLLLIGGKPEARSAFVQRGVAAADRRTHAAIIEAFQRGEFPALDHDPGHPR